MATHGSPRLSRGAFLEAAGATVATLVSPSDFVKTAGLGAAKDIPLPSAIEVRRMLRKVFVAQNDPAGSVVDVSGEFMEDYVIGAPFTGTTETNELPFVSQDGTCNLYCVNVNGANAALPNGIVRIVSDPFSEPQSESDIENISQTGWRYDVTALPPGNSSTSPTPLIVRSSDSSSTDVLLLYLSNGVARYQIGPDGSLVFGNFAADNVTPLVAGPLPPGTRWIPEYVGAYGSDVYRFRNPFTLAAVAVDAAVVSAPYSGPIKQLYPLSASAPGADGSQAYRCLIYYNDFSVVSATFSIAPNRAATVQRHQFVRRCNPGRFCMFEPAAYGLTSLDPVDADVDFYVFDSLANGLVQHYAIVWPPGIGPNGGVAEYDETTNISVDIYKERVQKADANTFRAFCTYNRANQTTEFFLGFSQFVSGSQTPKYDLFSMNRPATQGHDPSNWNLPTLIETGLRYIAPVDGPDVELVINRPATAYEWWTRNEASDFDVDGIRLESESGAFYESAGYRVGLMIKNNNTAQTEALAITASVATGAIVDGVHRVLGEERSLIAAPNGSGITWITVLLEDRLSFPDLIVTAPSLTDRFVLKLNDRAQGFFKTVTDQQLLDARDPRTCREETACTVNAVGAGIPSSSPPLVTDPARAKTAASVITQTVSASLPADGLEGSSAGVTVNSLIPYGWLPPSASTASLRRLVDPQKLPSWSVTRRDGALVFEELTAHEARLRIEATTSLPVMEAGFFDFFEDAFDAIGNLARSAFDSVAQVTQAVVAGVSVAITFVVDNVQWVYNGILKTVDMVMDAVEFCLEAAGMLIGQAIGWLLEQLGFLFDFKAIKARRDELRTLVSTSLQPALDKIGSPKAHAAGFQQQLAAAKSSAVATLNSIRSNPTDVSAFEGQENDVFRIAGDAFSQFSLLPQAIWLLEKVESVLPRFGSSGLGLIGIPGVEAALVSFFDVAVSNMSGVGNLLNALNSITSYVTGGKFFTESALDAALDIITTYVSAFFDLISAIVTAGANLLDLMWSNGKSILDWFDQTLPAPAFFRGFYKGLFGNDMSAFDVVCLLVAIPSVIAGLESPANDAGPPLPVAAQNQPIPRTVFASYRRQVASTPPETPIGQATIAFQSVTGLMSSISTICTNGSNPGGVLDRVGDVCSVISISALGIASILELIQDDLSTADYFGLGSLISVCGGVLIIGATRSDISLRKFYADNAMTVQAILAGLQLLYGIIVSSHPYKLMSCLLAALSHVVNVAARAFRSPANNPWISGAWGVVQAGLQAGQITIYALEG